MDFGKILESLKSIIGEIAIHIDSKSKDCSIQSEAVSFSGQGSKINVSVDTDIFRKKFN
jgi:hypothetical protein